MDMRTGYGHQGRTHSRCVVIAQTMRTLYKQSVEYCCGSLSSSLVNYTTRVSYQISTFEIYLQCCYWTLVQQLPQQLGLQNDVTCQSHVTDIVTQLCIIQKNMKGSRTIILYHILIAHNMYDLQGRLEFIQYEPLAQHITKL